MALDLFPALDVAPGTLRGALSSRGDVSFAYNDVIFGYQVIAKALQQSYLRPHIILS